MPRRPRIDLPGWHHVINRGVARSDVFIDGDDYTMFMMIVCKAAGNYRAVLHDYALMPNHYHMLIETESDNISVLMKQINSNYAIYFNKKYNRSGHLWQGRFNSRYVVDDEYLYTLMRYIENNPVEAGLSSKVAEYPYTLTGAMTLGADAVPVCAQDSILIEQIGYDSIREWVGIELSEDDLAILKEISRQKSIQKADGKRVPVRKKSLEQHLRDWSDISERNKKIAEAVGDGYSQAEVARYLGVTRAAVSQIINKLDI